MIFLLLLCTALCSHLFCADPSSRRFPPDLTEEERAAGIASTSHSVEQRLEHRLPTPWTTHARQERNRQTRNTRRAHPEDPTSRVPAVTRRPDTPADGVHIPEPPRVVRRTFRFAEREETGPDSRLRILARAERFHRPSTPPPSTAASPRAGTPDYTPLVATPLADEGAILRDRLRTEFPDLTPREIEYYIEWAERRREFLARWERSGNPWHELIP
ncbi:hypothetical protein EBQ93_03970 [bacterium]|nr:hypothetical protein [bacterium]